MTKLVNITYSNSWLPVVILKHCFLLSAYSRAVRKAPSCVEENVEFRSNFAAVYVYIKAYRESSPKIKRSVMRNIGLTPPSLVATSLILSTFASEIPLMLHNLFRVVICTPYEKDVVKVCRRKLISNLCSVLLRAAATEALPLTSVLDWRGEWLQFSTLPTEIPTLIVQMPACFSFLMSATFWKQTLETFHTASVCLHSAVSLWHW